MCEKLTHAVLLLQMLAHSIFGCCWHHAHAPGSTTCQHETVVAVESKAHACSHHAHDRHTSQSSDSPNNSEPLPHRGPPCGEERCQFVNCLKTDSPTELLQSQDFVDSSFMPERKQTITSVSRFTDSHGSQPPVCLSAVERCALFQAWLI